MERDLVYLGICLIYFSPLLIFGLFVVVLGKTLHSERQWVREISCLISVALVPLITTACFVSYTLYILMNTDWD